MKLKLFLILVIIFCIVVVTSSCAISKNTTGNDVIGPSAERVTALWNTRVNKDWKTFYALTDTRYRETITEAEVVRDGDMIVLGFEIISIADDPDDPKVSLVKVRFDIIKMGIKIKPLIMEKWILEEDGSSKKWFLYKSLSNKQRNPFFN
jgi:hypothetical protein